MESPPTPLTIEMTASVLNGLVLLEYVPVERITALLKSGKLALNWDATKYKTKWNSKNGLANETQQLTLYKNNYDTELGGVPVQYKKAKHGWGRVYVVKSLGFTSMGSMTRNTLLNELYYDLDLSNAQPKIIKTICGTNNIDCPQITDYCDRRGFWLESLAEHYGVSEKKIKGLFLRLCFFGTFVGWKLENKLPNAVSVPYISAFEAEMRSVAEKTKEVNNVLFQTARKLKENEKNAIGSFYALYLQEYELRIVEAVMCWIMRETDLMKHPTATTDTKCGAYEYDGIKLLKSNVDSYEGGLAAIIAQLNDITLELTGFDMLWEEKKIEKFHDITEALGQVVAAAAPIPLLKETCDKIVNRFDDTGVIEVIQEILPFHFVYSKKEWYCWNGAKWEVNDRPLRNAITNNVAEHWRGMLEPFAAIESNPENPQYKLFSETKSKLEDFIKKHLRDYLQVNKCVGQGKTILANDDLEFDSQPHLFGCKNGVFDFNEKCFRPYRFNDYLTWSCGHDFTPILKGLKYIVIEEGKEILKCVEGDNFEDEALTNLKDLFKKIFPDEAVRQLVLSILATGLSGKAIEKFFVFNGKGRNGKGVINEFMAWCLGDYCGYISPVILTEDPKKKTSSGSNPELASLNKIRYGIIKEPSKSQPIHNNVMKDITGGGEVKARMNYSNDTSVKLHLTLAMECNVKPPFAEAPVQADTERIVDIEFPAFFTDDETLHDESKFIYPLNTALKTPEWKDFHKNAFLNTLVWYLIDLQEKDNMIIDRHIPNSVKERSKAYAQQSYDIHKIFTTLFEIRNEENKDEYKNPEDKYKDEDWTLSKIVARIRGCEDFHTLPKRLQKEYTADNVKEFFKTNSYYKDSVKHNSSSKQDFLLGWRLKPTEDY